MSSAKKTYDGKIAGLYDLEETLGRGHFAVVKLARHVFTGEKVAVKVIDKTKLDDVSRAHLFQEVRCMKLVQHPNVVRLYEVIDTQTKLYLILELGDGGDLYDYIMKHESGLEEDMAKEYFRQIVRAISYCHQLHVVHRDLKPENVVFFERLGIVKLTDFGFSNKFCPGQKLDTSCGSLAYSAPEILLGDSYDAPAVDVWSLGVILYMLVVGQAPFQEANDSETLTMIMDCKYTIPVHVSEACKCLIAKMLVREPESRATLQDIASDPWLGGSSQVEYLPLVSRHQMTEEDHNIIINKMVNGNIATKEEVLEALDRNEYNHITATYFLLAERKLKTYRQEQAQSRLKQNLTLISLSPSSKNSLTNIQSADSASSDSLQMSSSATILSIPRNLEENTQGKVRKCSIVQEEEDEEEYCSVAGNSQELTPPHCSLNRRGSRSEGKLSVAIQERIAEERRKEIKETCSTSPHINSFNRISTRNDIIRTNKWTGPTSNCSGISTSYIPGFAIKRVNQRKVLAEKSPTKTQFDYISCDINLENNSSCCSVEKIDNQITNLVKEKDCKEINEKGNVRPKIKENNSSQMKASTNSLQIDINIENAEFTTVSLKDSATITIPFYPPSDNSSISSKFRTFPSPSKGSNLIKVPPFKGAAETKTVAEECLLFKDNKMNKSGISNLNCEQRKNKFHKAKTASCSSSEASDEDSETRKKRVHKISFEKKNQRKDSHDDSNDNQGKGGNGEGNVNSTSGLNSNDENSQKQNQSNSSQETGSNGGGDNYGGSNNQRKCNGENFRRNKRHTGETRLRESQSLNRIMEVQESEANNYSLMNFEIFQERLNKPENSNNYTINLLDKTKLNKSFGARFLQSWSNTLSSKKLLVQKRKYLSKERNSRATSETRVAEISEQIPKHYSDEKENKALLKETGKKVKVLGRYFQVSKKLCIPLPNLSSKGHLYKARSCGSISKDRIMTQTTSGTSIFKPKINSGIARSDNGKKENKSNQFKSPNFPKNHKLDSACRNGNFAFIKKSPIKSGKLNSTKENNSIDQMSEIYNPLAVSNSNKGEINKNVISIPEGHHCPSVGICQKHMRDAAKCHLS